MDFKRIHALLIGIARHSSSTKGEPPSRHRHATIAQGCQPSTVLSDGSRITGNESNEAAFGHGS
jgi:hypothetical protein